MLAAAIHHLYRVVLLVALIVALVATGFAHRMPAPKDDALAYALASGVSLADICGDDLGGAGHVGADCLACQITGTASLPPVLLPRIDLQFACHAAGLAPRERPALGRVQGPAHRPQGPPVG